jgi:hypothetical protein
VAQLFSLGGYTFMKITFTILLSSLLLCGCSQKQATSPKDFIQTGTDMTLNSGLCVLHVDKRGGDLLSGIRCVIDPGKSSESVLTADSGTITTIGTKDGHVILAQLVLHSWKDKNGLHDGQDTSIALRQ